MRIIVESCEKKIDNDNLDVFMWRGFSGIFKRKRECEDREQTRAVYRKLRRVVRACRGYTVYSSDFRWNVRAVEREWYPGDGILL